MDLLIFILAIVTLIIIHELGHFFAAKLFGIEVEEFGIGFPPRAVKLFKIAETEYTLNWIPLGGFVRIKGEGDPEVRGGLMDAAPWKRIVVFAAGPIANLVTAMILLTVYLFQVGAPVPDQVLVVRVDDNTPAQVSGLQVGDLILEINGVVINSGQVLHETIRANLGQDIPFLVERNGQQVMLQVVPRAEPPEGQGPVGFSYGNPSAPISVGQAFAAGTRSVLEFPMLLLSIPRLLNEGIITPAEARPLGYVGMFNLYQSIVDAEITIDIPVWVRILSFFAAISMSLGYLNLFPIPAVDGGRILFTLPEILFRRRIPVQFENVVNFVSFMLLLVLLVIINVQDIINPPQF